VQSLCFAQQRRRSDKSPNEYFSEVRQGPENFILSTELAQAQGINTSWKYSVTDHEHCDDGNKQYNQELLSYTRS
jgi:hypothetical protein